MKILADGSDFLEILARLKAERCRIESISRGATNSQWVIEASPGRQVQLELWVDRQPLLECRSIITRRSRLKSSQAS